MRALLAMLALGLLLTACGSVERDLRDDPNVRLFLAMVGDAQYSETSFSGAEADAIRDLVQAECPQGAGASFTRATYEAGTGSLVVYVTNGQVTCSILKPASAADIQYRSRAEAPEGVALTVNGEPVMRTQVQAALNALPEGTPRDEQTLGLVLNSMINDELLRQEAQHVEVTEEEIAAAREDLAQVSDAEQLERSAVLQAKLTRLLRERLLIDDINISPEATREFYLSNPNQFLRSEQAVMRHLFISAQGRSPEQLQRRVQQVAAALETTDFCELVRQYSDDPQNREQCGVYVVPRGVINPDLELASFTTPANQTAIVRTSDGTHLVQTLQVVPAQVVPYAQVEQQLQDALVNDVFQRRLSLYLTLLRSKADVVVYLS